MIILEDTRQQLNKHDTKHRWFEEHGITVMRCRLLVGDYTLPTNQSVCIDTKKDIQELVSDLVGGQHARFREEAERARKAGIRLIILVENQGGEIGHSGIYNPTIRSVDELHKWRNPRLFILKRGAVIGINKDGSPRYSKVQAYPKATKGVTLQKMCKTFTARHGAEFMFCSPQESAERIVSLLSD